MNHTWKHFSPFATHTAWILAMLAGGLEGDLPRVAIHSSKKGLVLKIKGVAVARGKDAFALMKNWEAEVAKAKAAEQA